MKAHILKTTICFRHLLLLFISLIGFNIAFAATPNRNMLNQPNFSDTAILSWANEAAVSAYSYSYANYRQRFEQISQYFMPEGWLAFKKALDMSNNLNAVIARKMVVSAVATGSPVIGQQGVVNDRYMWQVQVPMLVTYQNATEKYQQPQTITLNIVRVPTDVRAKGIGISQFVGRPAQAPEAQTQ